MTEDLSPKTKAPDDELLEEDEDMDQQDKTQERVSAALQVAFTVAQACADKKAENLKVLNVTEASGFTDFFVICSAMNERQVQAIADAVVDRLKADDHRPLSMEGQQEGRWVLIDYGEIVVHIFLDALREYYQLETLWADAIKIPIPEDVFAPAASRLN